MLRTEGIVVGELLVGKIKSSGVDGGGGMP